MVNNIGTGGHEFAKPIPGPYKTAEYGYSIFILDALFDWQANGVSVAPKVIVMGKYIVEIGTDGTIKIFEKNSDGTKGLESDKNIQQVIAEVYTGQEGTSIPYEILNALANLPAGSLTGKTIDLDALIEAYKKDPSIFAATPEAKQKLVELVDKTSKNYPIKVATANLQKAIDDYNIDPNSKTNAQLIGVNLELLIQAVGSSPLSPEAGSVKDAAEKIMLARKSAAEATASAQKIAAAQQALTDLTNNPATTLVELATYYTANQALLDSNQELLETFKAAVGNYVKTNPLTEIPPALSPIVGTTLKPNQRLVSYEVTTGRGETATTTTQIVLVERSKGQWSCPAMPEAKVDFNRNGEMCLKLPGQIIPVKVDWVADGAENYFLEQGVNQIRFRQIFADGIIDRDEWKSIADLNGDGVAELTGRAYSFFSNGGLVGLDGDDGITGEDLEGVFSRTIGSLLSKLEDDGQAALIYQYMTAKSYVLVPADQAASIVLGRTRTEVTAGEVARDYIVADADMQLTFKNTVLLVTGQEFTDTLTLTRAELALIFAFLGAFAQMDSSAFGKDGPFADYKVKTDNLTKSKDKSVLGDVDNFMLWLKGKEISTSTSGGSRAQKDAKLKEIYSRENKKNPSRQLQLGAEYIQGQTEDPMKAYDFYMAAIEEGSREYIPGMSQNAQAVGELVKVLTSTEDPTLYAKALEIIKAFPDGEARSKMLADLALKYTRLRDQSERGKALEIIQLCTTADIPWEQRGETKQLPKEDVISQIRDILWVDSEVYFISEQLFEEDQAMQQKLDGVRGKAYKVKNGITADRLIEAEKTLREFIADTTHDKKDRANALVVLGRVLEARAQLQGTYAEMTPFYTDAMIAYRTAWNTYAELLREEKDEDARTRYQTSIQECFIDMGLICYELSMKDTGIKEAHRLKVQLAGYIPNISHTEAPNLNFPKILLTSNTQNQGKMYDPKGFRENNKIKAARDTYTGLRLDNFSASPTTTTRPITTPPRNVRAPRGTPPQAPVGETTKTTTTSSPTETNPGVVETPPPGVDPTLLQDLDL
ncbi:MAG: hypothetical protein WC890_07520 [Candidatus Margulisiibacteriota bacterium]